MRTSNPSLKKGTFQRISYVAGQDTKALMTINGTVNKSLMLLTLLLVPATYMWWMVIKSANPVASVMPWLIGAAIGGFVVAMATCFVPRMAPITAPIYALLEGVVLGALSAFFEAKYPGIAIQGVALTAGVFLCMLLTYKSGLIKVTDKFRMGVVAATGAVFIIYLVNFVMRLFGTQIPFIHEGGAIGIGFSLVVVGIAALNLILDFDLIRQGAEEGAPKFMEWYGAFALLVTVVWLYLEILRLLAKLRSR